MKKGFKKAVGNLIEVIEGNDAGDKPLLKWHDCQAPALRGTPYIALERTSLFSKRLDAVKKLL